MSEDRAALPYVQLLGAPRVYKGESWRAFVPDQRYQLLAYLAYCGDWVSRDRAAFLFWPDTDSHKAKQNLRALLHRVRALEGFPQLEADAYRVRWPVATDVAAFRRALAASGYDEALSLYQGPFLRDMESDEAPEFSDWLALERGQLHATWREAVLRRAHTLNEAGHDAEAAALLGRLLAEDALDEEALQNYVTTLARAGQQREALRRYEVFAQSLRDEFGMEPTSATRQLGEAVKRSLLEPVSPLPESSALLPGAAPAFGPVDGAAPGWLPAPATSFVGRELELARVRDLLSRPDCRLLTLSGTGGIGKTRLALQVARVLKGAYRDGGFFVPLDALSSPESIPANLAAALELPLQGSDAPLAQVIRYLANKEVLLLLDNFEHLLDGATLASELLRGCPEVKLLVTSRERLDLKEEWVLPLEGLSYPAEGASLKQALGYEAVRLFANRAQKVRPGFSPTETELPHVLKLCRLAEGLPLALEMAAVWVRAMPAEEIAAEIETNLDLLSTTSRNARPRHRSVRAAFEHSWRLLSPTEQEVLRKLSVFRGGFRREAAAYVADASIAVLAALVDKSLLRLSPRGRYDKHSLIQKCAAEKLQEHEEEQSRTLEKHFGYYLALAEQAEVQLRGPEQTRWLDCLDEEHDNLLAAMDWTEASNQTELGLRLAGALRPFWEYRNHLHEGRERLRRLLSQPGATAHTLARAKALDSAGRLVRTQADYALARPLFEEGLAIYRELGDRWGVANSLRDLGFLAFYQADYASARPLLEEGLAIRRELGDRWGVANSLQELGFLALLQVSDYASVRPLFEEGLAIHRELGSRWGIATSLQGLGVLASDQADYASARPLLEESLAIYRELGDRWGVATSLQGLGVLASDQADYASACPLFEESLAIRWALGDKWGLAGLIEAFAALRAMEGKSEQAARLWGGAEALRGSIGASLPPRDRPRHEKYVGAGRVQLGEVAFRAAWTEGQMTPLEQVVGDLLEDTTKTLTLPR